MNSTTSGAATPVRLVHLSDVHVTARPLAWRRRDWLSKRVTGWINWRVLRRGHSFRLAETVLAALVADLRRRPPDRVIFSGDATALGFETEYARAAALLGVTGPDPLPGLAVPGNHDYYTRPVAASGLFERYFAPWQAGERIDDARYPFAQRAGPVWLIGVNSSTGSRWPWDASGCVGLAQLGRLECLLERLGPGPRILVTHYPYALPGGKPERRSHRLHDRRQLLAVAEQGQICLWLHGHRHDAYLLNDPHTALFPIICSGSATQTGIWSYGDYTLTGRHLHAVRRVFSPEEGCFRDGEAFELQLPG